MGLKESMVKERYVGGGRAGVPRSGSWIRGRRSDQYLDISGFGGTECRHWCGS